MYYRQTYLSFPCVYITEHHCTDLLDKDETMGDVCIYHVAASTF